MVFGHGVWVERSKVTCIFTLMTVTQKRQISKLSIVNDDLGYPISRMIFWLKGQSLRSWLGSTALRRGYK